MATRKPAPNPAPKPAPLLFGRPRPVAPPLPPAPNQAPLLFGRPRPVAPPLPPRKLTPIDMVRDPNYDIVMAQRNYENNLAQSIANSQLQNTLPPPPTDPARLAEYNAFMANQNSQTQPNNFTQGRLMGAPTRQSFPPGFNNEPEMTPQQYAESNKFMDDNIARIIAENPNAKNFLPEPIDSTDGMSKAQQEAIKVFRYNQFVTQARGGVPTLFGRPRPVAPIIPIPQNPQMATYNNLLQQGIQRSNTMNQDAASNFANMQAGAPTTQPAIPSPQLRGASALQKGLPRPSQPKGFGSLIGRAAF